MSTHEIWGFALALMAMTLYGLYMAPRSKSHLAHEAFAFWMGVGIVVGTSVIGAVDGGIRPIGMAQFMLVLVSGIVWGTGSLGYCRAVELIGLSRSTPVKNLSAVFGTLLGVVLFHEFSLSNPISLTLVLLGSAAIMISATLLGRIEAPDGSSIQYPSRGTLIYGFACALWAAIAYSAYTVPMKILYARGVSPSSFIFYMGQGCFIGMAIPFVLGLGKKGAVAAPRRDRLLAMISGLMWALGSICANMAVKLIGVAVTWPLTKTTLVAVLYGAWVLREIDLKRHRQELRYGIAFSIAGVLLLAFATAR